MAFEELNSTSARAEAVRGLLLRAGMGSGVMTKRQAILARHDAFACCEEYDSREWTWDGYKADRVDAISPGSISPLGHTQPADLAELSPRARRPIAPSRLIPSIISRFTGMLFGEGRIPLVTVVGDEEATAFLDAAFAASDFWPTMIASRDYGGAMGTAFVVVSLREGKFLAEAISPRCVQDVIWADFGQKIPAGVLIQYAYETERVVVADGQVSSVRGDEYVYRRIIDEEYDIVYEPAPVGDGGAIPEMKIQSATRHGLGTFPGAWIQNLPNPNAWDGRVDAEGQYEAVEAIDQQVSQSHRGIFYNQDPTVVLSRDKKYDLMGIPSHVRKGSFNALNVGLSGSASMLEIAGGGIAAAKEYVAERKKDVLDAAQCVILEPEKISAAAQSAKAIEYVHGTMLEKTGRMRTSYGSGIKRLAQVYLLFGRTWSSPEMYDVAIRRATFDLPARVITRRDSADPTKKITTEVPQSPGTGNSIDLRWGRFFQKTNEDVTSRVNAWASAYGGGLAPLERAARAIAEELEDPDVEGYVREVLEQDAARKATAAQAQQLDDGFERSPGDVFDAADVADRVERARPRFEEIDALEGTAPPPDDHIAKTAAVSEVSLNGAQVVAAKEIVVDVSQGRLPRESGVAMLTAFFGLSPAAAEQIMGEVGRTFSPPPEEASGSLPPKPPAV